MNHTWQETELLEGLRPDFNKAFICTRGDCRCLKFISKKGISVYDREKQIYSEVPECYGDIPLNQQSID